MAKITVGNTNSGYNLSAINSALQALATELNTKVLYRDNPTGEPNAMDNLLDMNSNPIINAGQISASGLVLNGVTVEPGEAVAAATLQRFEFIASAYQTSTSIAPLTPTVSNVRMTVNGFSVRTSSLSVVGSTVTFPALTEGDEVEISVYTRETAASPTADEVVFTSSKINSVSATLAAIAEGIVYLKKTFGAVGDGTADDTTAVNRFFNELTTNGGFGVIEAGDYKITSLVSIVLQSKGFYINGSGVSGSRFIVPSSFTGATPAFKLTGSGNQPTFEIGGFSIVSSGGGGTCTTGFQVGNESTGAAVIAGYNTSVIRNVFIADFTTGLDAVHARLIQFERCSVWNNNFSGANVCLRIRQEGLFTTDLVFDRCQFVNSAGAGRYCLDFNSDSIAYNNSNGNGSIAGIKFIKTDFYNGNRALNWYAGSGSAIFDIWFTGGTQIDQETTYASYGECNNTGSSISDIHFEGVYVSKTITGGIIFTSTGTGGSIKDIFVTECWIDRATSTAIGFFGTAVGSVTVTDNSIVDCATTGGAISFNGTQGFVCSGNKARMDAFSQQPAYLVDILSGCDDFVCTNNIGSANCATALIRDNSGDVQKIIQNNPGYNPVGQKTITVTASPFTYKNTSGAPEYVYVAGGTISNVAINGAFGVVATTNNCWVIPQGRTIVVTYSSAPTMFSLGL